MLSVHRHRLFKCNFKRSLSQSNGDTKIPVRSLKKSPPGRQFRILFMGRDTFSCLVLEELFKARDVWKEIIIATQPDQYIRRFPTVSPLRMFAEKFKLPVHTIPETALEFKSWEPPHPFTPRDKFVIVPPLSHLLITASFGRIFTDTQLQLFRPNRRLNVHPSLLPAYRGPAAIQYAIINDEKVSGVSITQTLKRTERMDAGPVWRSTEVPVPINATFYDLHNLLAVEGGKLLVSVLRDIISNKIAPVAQPSVEGLSFAPKITAKDAIIDFFTMSADAIIRRHRAFSHQKPLLTSLATSESLQLHGVTTTTSTSSDLPFQPGAALFNNSTNSLNIRCAEGSVLNVRRVKPDGMPLMAAKYWWTGLQHGGGFVALGPQPRRIRELAGQQSHART